LLHIRFLTHVVFCWQVPIYTLFVGCCCYWLYILVQNLPVVRCSRLFTATPTTPTVLYALRCWCCCSHTHIPVSRCCCCYIHLIWCVAVVVYRTFTLFCLYICLPLICSLVVTFTLLLLVIYSFVITVIVVSCSLFVRWHLLDLVVYCLLLTIFIVIVVVIYTFHSFTFWFPHWFTVCRCYTTPPREKKGRKKKKSLPVMPLYLLHCVRCLRLIDDITVIVCCGHWLLPTT